MNQTMVLLKLDDRLRAAYPLNFKGITVESGVFTYDGISQEEGDLAHQEILNTIDSLMFEDEKEKGFEKLIDAITDLPGMVYGVSEGILAIYERKQQLVNSWNSVGIPNKVQVEWDNDWVIRDEFLVNEWVAVSAIGMWFQCRTANDLWEIWKLNTELANHLDVMSEPLRTNTQYKIESATIKEEVDFAVSSFMTELHNLPNVFVATKAQPLITESGLTPIE